MDSGGVVIRVLWVTLWVRNPKNCVLNNVSWITINHVSDARIPINLKLVSALITMKQSKKKARLISSFNWVMCILLVAK